MVYLSMFIYIHIYIGTTDEGDRVVENVGCVIIEIIKFVDQDIIEFLSFFIYTYLNPMNSSALYIYPFSL